MGNSERQRDYNRQCGLPANWVPPQYLGPMRKSALYTTPGGIVVDHWGFRRKDIVDFKRNIRARVIPAVLDAIWAEVRAKYNAEAMPDDYPRIAIWDTIRWVETHGLYVGGLCTSARDACMAVWYRSVTGARGVTNWESIGRHELAHMIVGPWVEPEISSSIRHSPDSVLEVAP